MLISLSAQASLPTVYPFYWHWASVVPFFDCFITRMGSWPPICTALSNRAPLLSFSFQPVTNCLVNDFVRAVPLTCLEHTVHFSTLPLYLVFPFIFGIPRRCSRWIWDPLCVVSPPFQSFLLLLGQTFHLFPVDRVGCSLVVERISWFGCEASFSSLVWSPCFPFCHVALWWTASLQNLRFPVSFSTLDFRALYAVDHTPVRSWNSHVVIWERMEARYVSLSRSFLACMSFCFLQILSSRPQHRRRPSQYCRLLCSSPHYQERFNLVCHNGHVMHQKKWPSFRASADASAASSPSTIENN